MQIPRKAGTYILVLRLRKSRGFNVGCLGRMQLLAGYYCYVGSARGPGGLSARIERHLRKRKRLRWHVDYLRRVSTVEDVFFTVSGRRLECRWAGAMTLARVPRFGASDCGCDSHLFYSSRSPIGILRPNLFSLRNGTPPMSAVPAGGRGTASGPPGYDPRRAGLPSTDQAARKAWHDGASGRRRTSR